MSTESLRDLLYDRVADEVAVDLSGRAWRAGRRQRHRRQLAVVGGVVASTVMLSGGLAWVQSSPPRVPDPDVPTALVPHDPTLSSTPARTDAPASYEGVSVWFTPGQEQERVLAPVEGPLPRVIDLDVRSTALDGTVRAAFGTGNSVVLVDGFGFAVSIDVSRLDNVTRADGMRVSPVTDRMLSPDGAWLMFPQDGSVAIYEIASGRWTSIGTQGRSAIAATWADAGTIALPLADSATALLVFVYGGPTLSERVVPVMAPDFDTDPSQAYGRTVVNGLSRAQTWSAGAPLPVRDPTTDLSFPEFVAIETAEVDAALVVTWRSGQQGRSKSCCPVAGWLDERTLVYESRQAEPTLVAWTVGTDEFRRVSTIRGGYDVASFAALT